MAKTMDRIVIIGGGAAGLMAAVKASEMGAAVTILEHKDRVGKKILMTGNGKCNLTNVSDIHGKYYSSDNASLEKIYSTIDRFGAADTREFFQGLGLYTKEKRDGCVYPMSEQASVVLDVLRSACAHRGVEVKMCCEAVDIVVGRNGRAVRYLQENVKKDIAYGCLILAAGGKAAPASGSDGSGYTLAQKLGHSIITPLPALVQLRCEGDYFKSIAGVRVHAGLTLYVEKEKAAYEEGELQLTDYGISGIPVFQFSRIVSRALYENKRCRVVINFIPDISQSNRKALDRKVFGCKTIEELLSGMVHKKIASLICRRQGISTQKRLLEVEGKVMESCIHALRHFEVAVKGTNSFDNAQVCCGGVPLSEVSMDFESQKSPFVYMAGELLDCDGVCGGYNLQWAWATGAIAGAAAAKRILKRG